jgi:hypothetical protein
LGLVELLWCYTEADKQIKEKARKAGGRGEEKARKGQKEEKEGIGITRCSFRRCKVRAETSQS